MVSGIRHQGKLTASQDIALVLKLRFVAVPFEI
jgi:hypothetical protein